MHLLVGNTTKRQSRAIPLPVCIRSGMRPEKEGVGVEDSSTHISAISVAVAHPSRIRESQVRSLV